MTEIINPCIGCRFNIAKINDSLCSTKNLYGNEGVFINPVTNRCQLTGQIIEVPSQYTTCLSRRPKITPTVLPTLP